MKALDNPLVDATPSNCSGWLGWGTVLSALLAGGTPETELLGRTDTTGGGV